MREIMREIKFRGMDRNGIWHEGYLLYRDSSICIQEVINVPPCYSDPGGDLRIDFYPVEPETVGQYIGLKDKKRTEEFPEGQEIYEGDILIQKKRVREGVNKFTETDEIVHKYPVIWDEGKAEWSNISRQWTSERLEIIGNIHEK